jgi:hypothetical protein
VKSCQHLSHGEAMGCRNDGVQEHAQRRIGGWDESGKTSDSKPRSTPTSSPALSLSLLANSDDRSTPVDSSSWITVVHLLSISAHFTALTERCDRPSCNLQSAPTSLPIRGIRRITCPSSPHATPVPISPDPPNHGRSIRKHFLMEPIQKSARREELHLPSTSAKNF